MALKKRGVTFKICFRKRGVPRKGGGGGGFPYKRRGSNPVGNYEVKEG